MNEAALRAVRKGRQAVNQEDLLVSFETVIAGTEKKNTVLTDMEKRLVAYHEVGHALVAALEKHSQPVSKITIVPHTSGALGYTMQMPEEEKFLNTADELRTELRTLVGGRAAEVVVFLTDGRIAPIAFQIPIGILVEEAGRIAAAPITFLIVVIVFVHLAGNLAAAPFAFLIVIVILMLRAGNALAADLAFLIVVLILVIGTRQSHAAVITHGVCVRICVQAEIAKRGTAGIAKRIFILIYMLFAGNRGLANIAFTVAVFILMLRTGHGCLAPITLAVAVIILMLRAGHRRITAVTPQVVVRILVLRAGRLAASGKTSDAKTKRKSKY